MRALALLLTILTLGCGRDQNGSALTVSCAMGLSVVAQDLGDAFVQKHPGTPLRFNFAASGKLAAQLRLGAPVDLFLSASLPLMDDLERRGVVVRGSRVDFATNTVVLIAPRGSPLTSVGALSRFSGRLALGNPASVPAGRYARDGLRALKLYDRLRPRMVFGEHVRQVLDYVVRGEVDAGLVYRTDYLSAASRVRIVGTLALAAPVIFPAALVASARHATRARQFLTFLRSKEARAILVRAGYSPPPETAP